MWSKHGRDVRLLIPHYHKRGNRRPRLPKGLGDKPDSYKLMRHACEEYYLGWLRRRKNYAYARYLDFCKHKSVPPLGFRSFSYVYL